MTVERYVCLYRVSTQRQGTDGYGLQAQQDCCRKFCAGKVIIQEFQEIVSGRSKRRPVFNLATRACRKFKAKLLVSRFDRVSRRKHFLSELSSMGIQLKVATHPEADDTVLMLYSVIAENEAKLISERTKRALEVRRTRGDMHTFQHDNYKNLQRYAVLKNQVYRLKDNKRYREAAQYHRDKGLTLQAVADLIMEDHPASKHITPKQVQRWLLQNKTRSIVDLEAEMRALEPLVTQKNMRID